MTDPTPSTPVTIRDQMQMVSEGVRGSSNHTLSTIWTKLDTLETSIDELKAQVTLLQEGLGASPYQALTLTTVRGLLNAMLGRLTTIAFGTAPELGGDYISDSEIFYDGRKYATFDGPISGVTISPNKRDITNSNWSGWEFYIQTTDPSPWVNGIPTQPNGWLGLGLFSTVNFSVEGQYPIKVYLRFIEANVTCYSSTGVNQRSSSYVLLWPNPPFTMVSKPANEDRYVFILEDVNGWTVKNNSGAAVSVIAWARPFSGSIAVNTSVPAGGTYTFTNSVIYAFVESNAPLLASDFLFCEPVLTPS